MKRWPLAVFAVAVLLLGVLIWRDTLDTPRVTPVPRPARVAPSAIAPVPEPPTIAEEPPPPPPADAALAEPERRPAEPSAPHLADPCTQPIEPVLPTSYESVTSHGITVAWNGEPDRDRPFHPLVFASAVRGVLDEAAELTGTAPREQLTVIVYPSQPVFLSATHSPGWSGGLYDGSAVRVPASTLSDVGVAMSTVRHEVMHAQLHTAIGCMPAWLNEGLAMYFAGDAPIHDWIAMLGDRDRSEAAVGGSTFAYLDDDRAGRAYGESLARVLYVVGHGGGTVMRELVQSARTNSQRGIAVSQLWELTYPRVSRIEVLDALARRVFELPLGKELEAVTHGPMCCTAVRNVRNLACHAAALGSESLWVEKGTHAWCRNQW